jgi:hypothetical protein
MEEAIRKDLIKEVDERVKSDFLYFIENDA